jgi:surface antigen
MKKAHEGDKVSWKSPDGKVKGKVVAVKTKRFQLHGAKVNASADDPRYLVESKSGVRASHAAHALKKR